METYGDPGLGALGDPTRRAIFELLARGPQSVGELAAALPISRPAVSQHLRVLKDAGLVIVRPAGTRRIYQINPDGVAALRTWLDRVWDDAMDAFQRSVEETETETDMTLPPVTRSITVNAPVEKAFQVFTERMHSWWPAHHHLLPGERAAVVVEPGEGGRWYERAADGAECDWGRVLAWEPPTRLLLAWHLDGTFSYDPDPTHASEVEVIFTDLGDNRTRVNLVHRHFERHGATAPAARAGVDDAEGWTLCLELFCKTAETA